MINFEYKKKHLRRVYTNAEKMLDFLNRKYLSCNDDEPILEEELLSKLITDLEVIMNNCKTGNFIND